MRRRSVRFSAVLPLLAQHATWRLTGCEAAGRAVVRALASEDPTTRTMAGMLLTRARRRAVPFLRDALDAGQTLPMVVAILADLGDEGSRSTLDELTRHPDATIAGAAREALRVLDARKAVPGR